MLSVCCAEPAGKCAIFFAGDIVSERLDKL